VWPSARNTIWRFLTCGPSLPNRSIQCDYALLLGRSRRLYRQIRTEKPRTGQVQNSRRGRNWRQPSSGLPRGNLARVRITGLHGGMGVPFGRAMIFLSASRRARRGGAGELRHHGASPGSIRCRFRPRTYRQPGAPHLSTSRDRRQLRHGNSWWRDQRYTCRSLFPALSSRLVTATIA
jgi:hypothetical protein